MPIREWELTKFETATAKALFERMYFSKEHTFTSDDLRLRYGLDKHMRNPQQDVGKLIAKLKHHGYIEAVDRVRSVLPKNGFREITVWGQTAKSSELYYEHMIVTPRVKGA